MASQQLPHADKPFILMSDFDGTITERVRTCNGDRGSRAILRRLTTVPHHMQDSNDTATDDVRWRNSISLTAFRADRDASPRNSSASVSSADENSTSTS